MFISYLDVVQLKQQDALSHNNKMFCNNKLFSNKDNNKMFISYWEVL